MKTLANPAVTAELVSRMERLSPAAERRWGTLTSAEMLCHLTDCSRSVLSEATPAAPLPKARPVFKWIALYSQLRWPKGRIRTRAELDPKRRGSRPAEFERDRAAAIAGVRALAAAGDDAFSPVHSMFGPMSADDWRRWGYLHTDHHLRQFGL